MQAFMHLLLLLVLWLPWTMARVVAPDIAGMIYTSTSTSSHFGDLSSPSPTACEFVAPSTDSVVCTDARLCLRLKLSSEFKTDPFFLHQYDAKYPVVSATFDAHDPNDILPLIPGEAAWWFQSNATATGPVIDLLLRLRQRSQRLSARDQLLVIVRVELVDSRTITSSIEAYGVYGNQRVTHTTHRVDTNTIQVLLSITKNAEKRDVVPLDAYPLVSTATTDTDVSSSTGSSCDACDGFLDACEDSEPCQTIVLPCLITQLKALAFESSEIYDRGSQSSSQTATIGDDHSGDVEAGEAGSGDEDRGSGRSSDRESWYDDFLNGTSSGNQEENTNATDTKEVDFLELLATCVADVPLSTWVPLRRVIFCLAHSACPLGIVQGADAGEELPSLFRLTNGSQKFVVTPTISGTDNVDLTIVKRDIRDSVANHETFSYSASASYLGMFLRSFVLLQAAEVSVSIKADFTYPDALQVTLAYSEALMISAIGFSTTTGQLIVIETSPPRAVIEYPASSSRPVLDIIIGKLETRVKPTSGDNHSWIVAEDCVSCSAKLFGCTTEAVEDNLCNYNTATSSFGQCIRRELPPSHFAVVMAGNSAQRPINAAITRCMDIFSSNADGLAAILDASFSLANFAATRCPFGPIALVEDTQMIVLETSSYIQLLRISPSASVDSISIKIQYRVGGLLIATSIPIYATAFENQIEQVINDALVSTGILGAVRSSTSDAGSEWTLEIIYHHVFLPSKFSIEAVTNDASLKADAITQVVMEGGSSQLRVVPRDSSKVFSKTTATPDPPYPTSTTGPGSPTTTSSPSSRLAGLTTTDACRQCQAALARCQNNADCAVSSKNQLVPYLRDAMPSAGENVNDPTRLEIDLAYALQTLPTIAFGTSEAWHAFTGEISCLAQSLCETEYDDSTGNYQPSFVSVGKVAIIYRVRTFRDTEWKVIVGGNEFLYTPEPDAASSLDVAIPAFERWIEALAGRVPFELVVHAVNWDGNAISGAGAFDVKFYGGYDGVSECYTMLSPSLLPIFQVVGGTETGGVDDIQYAGASFTFWEIKLWSIGQNPHYDKFLDLLEIGLAGTTPTPTPSSTTAHEISSTDPCRKCSSTLSRCQNNADCVSLTTNWLIPLLSTTPLPLLASVVDDYGTTAFRADLYPILALLTYSPYYTRAAWDLLAAEFYCLAYGSCDVEYSDVFFDQTSVHAPMNLELARSSVSVELRTYSDTEWDIAMNGNIFSYKPIEAATGSIDDSSLHFQKWLHALGTQDSLKLEIQVHERVISSETGTATLSIRIFGSYDDELYQYLMVNPAMIPNFSAVGGTVEGVDEFSRAEVNVTLPSLILSSTRQKPQFTKLLTMLSDGIDNAPPVTTPAPTPTSASRSMFTNDLCRQCEGSIALCRDDTDCVDSSRNTLVPLLRDYGMAVSTRAETEDGNANVALSMAALLHSLASLSDNAFLTRSGWDVFANELACFAVNTCDLEYADVDSPFLGFHIPTHLTILEESVFLSVRTYADTAWSMWLNGELLSYAPDSNDPMTINDAVATLHDWIESQLSQQPYNLVVDRQQPNIDSVSLVATIGMSFHGLPTANGNLIAPPWLIPRFEVAGGTVGGGDSGLPLAEANVTLWDISIVSLSQRPQYGKFLDLLAFGLDAP